MSLKSKLINSTAFCIAVALRVFVSISEKLKLLRLYQRSRSIEVFAEPDPFPPARPKLCVAIAHITSSEEASSPTRGAVKTQRLEQTIEGLLCSFAHCDLTILISTLPGRSVAAYLPDYQRRAVIVQDQPDWDPMYIGYRAQEALASRVNDYDWFMFIEDDIVISDSRFLDKLARFNQYGDRNDRLLFPNRYEMYEGRKSYIDLTIDSRVAWDKLSTFDLDGAKLSECTNCHSGMYCLSKAQMQRWVSLDRKWNGTALMVGPLESAATFCLMEHFSIYKPNFANLNYLEVRHYDTKYSKLLPEPSPYIISAIGVLT